MTRQPWVSRDNPLGYLWVRELIEAVGRGAVSRDLVESTSGRVFSGPRCSTSWTTGWKRRHSCPRSPDSSTTRSSSYRKMGAHAGTRLGRLGRVRAILRHVYQRSPLFRIERKLRAPDN